MIYLDNSATTQPFPDVIRVVSEVMADVYGNPSSLHGMGLKAERLLNQAREVAAKQLDVSAEEIVFTSGGTESNNLAIKGALWAYRNRGNHVITTEVEHASVFQVFEQMEQLGFKVTYLPVDEKGRVQVEQVEQALSNDTILVSVMAVNNEIGTIQPVRRIAQLLNKRPKTLFHVDAVQAFGKVPLPDRLHGIDLLSLSGHKFHAPKGTGLLYVKKGVSLHPHIVGGGQENGLRSGTENVPGAVGLAKAMQASRMFFEENRNKWLRFKQRFVGCLSELPDVKINGDRSLEGSAPHIVSASFVGLKGEVLLHALEEKNVYVGTKSACSSKRHAPSRVLTACGLNEREAEGTLRISMGQFTTEDDVDQAIAALTEVVGRLRKDLGGTM